MKVNFEEIYKLNSSANASDIALKLIWTYKKLSDHHYLHHNHVTTKSSSRSTITLVRVSLSSLLCARDCDFIKIAFTSLKKAQINNFNIIQIIRKFQRKKLLVCLLQLHSSSSYQPPNNHHQPASSKKNKFLINLFSYKKLSPTTTKILTSLLP